MFFREEKKDVMQDLVGRISGQFNLIADLRRDLNSEITEIRKEFRNKLEAEKIKNKDLLTEVLSNPPKYKSEDVVFYGDKKYFVYNIKNIKNGDYFYNIYLKDREGCVIYGSVINDVSEGALYTKKK